MGDMIMNTNDQCCDSGVSRRAFLQVSMGAMGGLPLLGVGSVARAGGTTRVDRRKNCLIRGAFVYPPTESLREAGYYSWPGSGFDAEARHRGFVAQLLEVESALDVRIDMDTTPLDDEASAIRFSDQVAAVRPDGILLILLKKGHWPRVKRIIDAVRAPAVIYAPLGVLLVDHIAEARELPGVYLVNSERFDAVQSAIGMIRAAAWMRQSRILNIDGAEDKRVVVPCLGTEVHTVPHQRFYDEFARTELSEEVLALAASYTNGAKAIVEPSGRDIQDAAKCHVALKRMVESDSADAVMMNCLPGLQHPRKHVPPCMGFMGLRDSGVPAGCQSDLNATLTLLLVQYLFERPGFQQNASMDTEQNLYFGAHCTCPSRMNGLDSPPEPYILRSHAEAGWGCVPRVLFPEGQDVTMAQYVTGDSPEMYIYTGTVVACPETPPSGGCRTNILMTINEVEDVRDVKGMHQIIFFGHHGRALHAFCHLLGIRDVA